MATDVARMAFLLVFLLITQLIFNEPEVAATVIARLTTIILGAQLFTRTTKIKHLVASIEKLMTPLKPLGANPHKIALAVALMLSALGQIMGFIRQVRDAQRARGGLPWAWVVLVVGAVVETRRRYGRCPSRSRAGLIRVPQMQP